MLWLVSVIAVLALIVIILSCLPMKIPRAPDREGIQEHEAVQAYDQVSRSVVFNLVRHVVLHELGNYHPEGILVDIGCGPGHLVTLISAKFPQLKIIGVDISDEMLKLARQKKLPLDTRKSVAFLQGDVGRLAFKENAVDFVVSTLSLHHWADAGESLREIYRVLKPGGQFLLLDLRRDGRRLFYYVLKFSQAFLVPGAIRRTNGAIGSFWSSYTPEELKGLLSEIPFAQYKVKTRLGWMFVWSVKAGVEKS